MTLKLNSIVFSLLIVCSSSFAGCVRDATPLQPEEIGELSVIVTLDFGDRGNETANLEERLTNGSITFDPVMVSNNTSAYRVMEALQLRENFSIDVTYYVGMGAFIHTIDGVSGASDYSTYWGFYENGEMAAVGASSLMITANTNLSWVMVSSTDY